MTLHCFTVAASCILPSSITAPVPSPMASITRTAHFTSSTAGLNTLRAERAWELASLRVLGFSRGEVSIFLLGELAFELLVAIPIGLFLGWLLSFAIIAMTHSETMIIPLVIAPRTYAYAALATLAAGIVSALIVRHRIDRLDLVAVLKTRE